MSQTITKHLEREPYIFRCRQYVVRGVLFWSAAILGALLVFLFLEQPVAAQDVEPKRFYEEDFAKDPLNTNRGTTPRVERERPKPKNSTPKGTVSEKRESPQGLAGKDGKKVADTGEDPKKLAEKETSREADDIELLLSEPILALGAVINSLDKAHFDTQIREVLQLATDYDLQIGVIYAIGDIRNVLADQDLLLRFAVFGGQVKPVEELPEQYRELAYSPTWLLNIEPGIIMLEGVGSLRKFLNSRGEFIESLLPDFEEDTGKAKAS